jgi:hypothetical protein
MIMRLISAILIGSFGFSACNKSKDDKPETQDPISLIGKAEILPLEGAKWASFMSVPWEKRCEGIQDILETFQRNNLPGYVITPRATPGFPACMVTWGNIETARERYEYGFRISKDGRDLDFQVQISAGPSIYRSIGLVNIDWIKGDSVVSVDSDVDELKAIHPSFQHLDKTLDAWYLKDDVEASIFGRRYSEYLSEVSSAFGEQGGFILKNPNLRMKLTMDAKVPGKGVAEFLEADNAVFSSERGPLLGCNDFNCLKGSTVRFQALGTKFLFDRVIESQTGGTTLVGTWHYQVANWPLNLE